LTKHLATLQRAREIPPASGLAEFPDPIVDESGDALNKLPRGLPRGRNGSVREDRIVSRLAEVSNRFGSEPLRDAVLMMFEDSPSIV
jgi:hypothetical protein